MTRNHSEKLTDADNQQERLIISSWICGFVDGEGCFSVSVIVNKTTKSGVQIFPEFVVTQGAKSLAVLKEIKNFFGCGNIFVNKRYDNHHEHLYRYCVRSLADLEIKIIPFFMEHNVKTYKRHDFKIFTEVVMMMFQKKHLNEKGKNKILRLISNMNRKKKR